MVTLVALLSSGKGTWGQVNSLIKLAKWDKIYLICNEFAYENFELKDANVTKLKFDEKKPTESFVEFSRYFKKEIKDFEVALNITSGVGLEHMTIISAILKAGLGIRFVYADFDELKEFEILDEKFVPQEDDEF